MDTDFLHQIETVDELLPPSEHKLDDDTLICECFCVNARDIREICLTKVNLDLLTDHFHMGQGCQSCIKNKDCWINSIF